MLKSINPVPCSLTHVHGDLLDQRVDAIVNPWNRNIIPWWLLLPQGVSGAIKKRGGTQPFRELAKVGAMELGSAVWTSAGRLPFKGIVHVAGINVLWRATLKSIRESTANAVRVADQHEVRSLAFPLIGAGSGGFSADRCKQIMSETLSGAPQTLDVVIVEYKPSQS